jgi:hypothetical protein
LKILTKESQKFVVRDINNIVDLKNIIYKINNMEE